MSRLNATHDPARKSWIASANRPDTDFPIQNLPYCLFSRPGEAARAGVAIGDGLFDLEAALDAGLLDPELAPAIRGCRDLGLNPLMQRDAADLGALRLRLSGLLGADDRETAGRRDRLVVAAAEATLHRPARIGGFTDFFTSFHHTERGGRLARPDNPVPPNFRHMPIAYNSRASSVRVSGEAVRRPKGQWRDEQGVVRFGPCAALDFELELGACIGRGNPLGDPIAVGDAAEHIFGYCLLNDWSARDIQRWESFPLGPFLSKSLSTTISPYIVTADALAPFRTAAGRPACDPGPLSYLRCETDEQEGGIDLVLEAFIETAGMRAGSEPPVRITRTNFKDMYWTFAQMVAHHTSNGCNLMTGDLIGSGTTSGPTDESRACLLEITLGRQPVALPDGESRCWLEDGDSIVLAGRAERAGFVSIGFGRCEGRILPAHP